MEQKSTAQKLEEAAKLKAEQEAKRAEQVKMLKDCANRIFSTDDGKFFARAIYQTSGIFEAPDFAHNPQALDGQQLAFQKGMETLYILFFRKILDKDVLSAIERVE
jgi:hypothetical protein